MKLAAALAALTSLALTTGCGNSGGLSNIVTPVQAQTGYSIASITGTYSLSLASPTNNSGNGFAEAIGSFTADGAGKISSGTLVERFGGATAVCTLAFPGTYSLQSNASGTATLTVTSTLTSGSGGCPNATLTFNIYAGQSGASLLFNETDSSGLFSGNATKQ
jgi:hypothetical protein